MNKNKNSLVLKIFLGIFLILLAINIYFYLFSDGYVLSFSSLFKAIEDAPKIDTSFITLTFQTGISADWGVFNFARDFINGLYQIIGVVLFVCIQIANVCVWIFELIRTIFVGVLG